MWTLSAKAEVTVYFEAPLPPENEDTDFKSLIAYDKRKGYVYEQRKNVCKHWGSIYTSWFDPAYVNEPDKPRRFLVVDDGVFDNKTHTLLSSFEEIAEFLERETMR